MVFPPDQQVGFGTSATAVAEMGYPEQLSSLQAKVDILEKKTSFCV
jgi:hypothetical protein